MILENGRKFNLTLKNLILKIFNLKSSKKKATPLIFQDFSVYEWIKWKMGGRENIL